VTRPHAQCVSCHRHTLIKEAGCCQACVEAVPARMRERMLVRDKMQRSLQAMIAKHERLILVAQEKWVLRCQIWKLAGGDKVSLDRLHAKVDGDIASVKGEIPVMRQRIFRQQFALEMLKRKHPGVFK
jgi:hypothetical protein